MRDTPWKSPRRTKAGFTLVELMMVVGIIGIAAAVSLPAIASFLRGFKGSGAAQQVVGELQKARLTAISRGVNLGVAFIPGYPAANQYQYILEDTVATGSGSNLTQRQPAPSRSSPVNGAPHGFIGTLPTGTSFVATTATGAGRGIRFNRLGTACNIHASSTTGACRALASPEPGGPLYVDPTTGNMVITLKIDAITKTITIGPGGRPVMK